jgi:hypothetical protein
MSIPNRDKDITPAMCASIYWNLIELHETKSNFNASSIVREFWQTERCDKIGTDFSGHREAFKNYLSPEVTDRIMNYTSTDVDKEKSIDAVGHYYSYTQKILVQALPLSTKLYYHTIHKPERLILLIGGGGIGGLGKWMYRQHKILRATKNTK